METIAARLRSIRRAEGIGLRPFAERVSGTGYPVSHAAVNGYESGAGGPEKIPADYLAAVCRAFGVSPGWLLLGQGQMHEPDQTTKADAYDEMWHVMERAREAGRRGLRLEQISEEQLTPMPENAARKKRRRA